MNIARGPAVLQLFRPRPSLRRTWPKTNVFEFYRDIRTYGRGQEELYVDASKQNVLFLRFSAEEPPVVEKNNDSDEYALSVQVKDRLTFGEEIRGPGGSRSVVCRDGTRRRRRPCRDDETSVGSDRFLQEVHPKLSPLSFRFPASLSPERARRRWTRRKPARLPPPPRSRHPQSFRAAMWNWIPCRRSRYREV